MACWHDDDPAPREMVPSGVLDRLPDGAQYLSYRDMPVSHRYPVPPPNLTVAQRKRWARDVAILAARQRGMSISAIALGQGLNRDSVRKALRRCERYAAGAVPE